MPTRHPSHIKETIACRRFEAALMPDLVAQDFTQGQDYGIDYIVTAFDNAGRTQNRFSAKVKYVPLAKQEKWFSNAISDYSIRYISDLPRCVRYRISLGHLWEYVDPGISKYPTLYVLANERDFFYFWVNDLYDYFLQWVPEARRKNGTFTLYLANIRSLDRILIDKGYRRGLWPSDNDYLKGQETYLLREFSGDAQPWLGRWCTPGTVDSLTNVGLSAYIHGLRRRGKWATTFDTPGFWAHLQSDRRKRTFCQPIILAFSRLIRTHWRDGSMGAADSIRMGPYTRLTRGLPGVGQ